MSVKSPNLSNPSSNGRKSALSPRNVIVSENAAFTARTLGKKQTPEELAKNRELATQQLDSKVKSKSSTYPIQNKIPVMDATTTVTQARVNEIKNQKNKTEQVIINNNNNNNNEYNNDFNYNSEIALNMSNNKWNENWFDYMTAAQYEIITQFIDFKSNNSQNTDQFSLFNNNISNTSSISPSKNALISVEDEIQNRLLLEENRILKQYSPNKQQEQESKSSEFQFNNEQNQLLQEQQNQPELIIANLPKPVQISIFQEIQFNREVEHRLQKIQQQEEENRNQIRLKEQQNIANEEQELYDKSIQEKQLQVDNINNKYAQLVELQRTVKKEQRGLKEQRKQMEIQSKLLKQRENDCQTRTADLNRIATELYATQSSLLKKQSIINSELDQKQKKTKELDITENSDNIKNVAIAQSESLKQQEAKANELELRIQKLNETLEQLQRQVDEKSRKVNELDSKIAVKESIANNTTIPDPVTQPVIAVAAKTTQKSPNPETRFNVSEQPETKEIKVAETKSDTRVLEPVPLDKIKKDNKSIPEEKETKSTVQPPSTKSGNIPKTKEKQIEVKTSETATQLNNQTEKPQQPVLPKIPIESIAVPDKKSKTQEITTPSNSVADEKQSQQPHHQPQQQQQQQQHQQSIKRLSPRRKASVTDSKPLNAIPEQRKSIEPFTELKTETMPAHEWDLSNYKPNARFSITTPSEAHPKKKIPFPKVNLQNNHTIRWGFKHWPANDKEDYRIQVPRHASTPSFVLNQFDPAYIASLSLRPGDNIGGNKTENKDNNINDINNPIPYKRYRRGSLEEYSFQLDQVFGPKPAGKNKAFPVVTRKEQPKFGATA